MWEDPWIPITPARPARPAAPVLHPNMRVIDLINQGIEGMGYTFYKKLGAILKMVNTPLNLDIG